MQVRGIIIHYYRTIHYCTFQPAKFPDIQDSCIESKLRSFNREEIDSQNEIINHKPLLREKDERDFVEFAGISDRFFKNILLASVLFYF